MVLLLGNMTLLIWCVSYLEIDKNSEVEKTFISNVKAEPVPVVLGQVIHKDTILQVIPSATPQYPASLQLASSTEKKPQQQITLHFQAKGIQLDHQERDRLEKLLQEFKMNSSYRVQILAGPMRSENNANENAISSLQTIKLRAQSIARVIYPYTQNIKMLYRPSLDERTMVVEFFWMFSTGNAKKESH
jgi:hypothetical protein